MHVTLTFLEAKLWDVLNSWKIIFWPQLWLKKRLFLTHRRRRWLPSRQLRLASTPSRSPWKVIRFIGQIFLLAIIEIDPRKWWDTHSSVIWPAAPEQEREHREGADVDATAGDGAEDAANLDPVDENLWWKFKGTNQADKDEDHRLPCSKVRDWIKRQSLLFSGWGELLVRLKLFSITCSRERGRRQSWTRSKQRRVFSPQQTRRGPPPARRRQAWISSWKFRVVWKDLKAKDHAYDGPKATEHQRVLLQFDLLPKKSWFKFWGVFSSISDNLETHLVGLDTMHDVEDITSPSSKE